MQDALNAGVEPCPDEEMHGAHHWRVDQKEFGQEIEPINPEDVRLCLGRTRKQKEE